MKKILLLGYGNPDREDDGVAWHILRAIALELGLPVPESYDEPFPEGGDIEFAFSLQLTPEMAEDINAFEHVCFVDAHTGSIPEAVRLIAVDSEFQRSPLTHHLTPQSLLSICKTVYGGRPNAALLSVRGYRFLFSRELSEETQTLVPQAVNLILSWLRDGQIIPATD